MAIIRGKIYDLGGSLYSNYVDCAIHINFCHLQLTKLFSEKNEILFI